MLTSPCFSLQYQTKLFAKCVLGSVLLLRSALIVCVKRRRERCLEEKHCVWSTLNLINVSFDAFQTLRAHLCGEPWLKTPNFHSKRCLGVVVGLWALGRYYCLKEKQTALIHIRLMRWPINRDYCCNFCASYYMKWTLRMQVGEDETERKEIKVTPWKGPRNKNHETNCMRWDELSVQRQFRLLPHWAQTCCNNYSWCRCRRLDIYRRRRMQMLIALEKNIWCWSGMHFFLSSYVGAGVQMPWPLTSTEICRFLGLRPVFGFVPA